MAKKKVKAIKKEDNKVLFAFLATFLSIIGFVISLIAKRDDKYVMFYAKQSLVVFIFAIIVAICKSIFELIPILGIAINVFLSIFVILLWLASWVYALTEEEKEVPVIGKYARKIRL